jgi:sterol desaturase/sphingolipid hydroxylase (fatty acid hydroxylase superfamily)
VSFVAFLEAFPRQAAGPALALAVCVFAETVIGPRYTLRQRLPGVVFTFVGAFTTGMAAWLLQGVWSRTGLGVWIVLPVHDWLRPLGPLAWTGSVLASLAAYDFFSYWRHRAEHKWFWPIHALHHSPAELHAANNWSHPLAIIPGFIFVSVPVSLIQMPGPTIPAALAFFVSLLASYVHSPIDLHFGPLRRVVVDNRFHRIHHSRGARHRDMNFGVLFSFWDAIFGTAIWPTEWPAVGIDRPAPKSLVEFFAYPFAGQQLMISRRRDAGKVTEKSRSSLAAHVEGEV